MATQLQIRRGTTSQMNAFTGAEGELAVNTTTDTVHVHDGSTAGGFALAKADGSNIATYAGSFTTISASGAITGNVTGNLTGSILTAAQTNITSVGTLSTLAVTGALTVDTNTLVVDATNNRVGIGTSSPSVNTEIRGSASNGQLRLGGSTTATYANIYSDNDGVLILGADAGNNAASSYFGVEVDGTERMRIDSSGNVGIGNSSPTDKLHLGTSSGGTQLKIQSGSGINNCILHTNGTTDSWRTGMNLSLTDGSYEFYDDVNNVSRMVIDASGSLLVGATSQPSSFKMFVDSGANSSVGIRGSSTTYNAMVFYTPASATAGFIQVSGSTTSYNQSSDYRLKENVVAMSGATERLKQLNPSRFNFIADADTTVDGFLAHEVQDVVPEAITGTKDAMRDEEYEVTPAVLDDDGNVTTEAVMGTRSVPDYQGIDQSKLVPLLVATIQELEARLTALENNS